MKVKVTLTNIIMACTWLTFLIIFMLNINMFTYYQITLAFLICNIICSFLNKKIYKTIVFWLIVGTGIIRYVVIPIQMRIEGIVNTDTSVMLIMIVEMIFEYLAIIVFANSKKFNEFTEKKSDYFGDNKKQGKEISFKVGISILAILILFGFLIVRNTRILYRYIEFSTSKVQIEYSSGLIELMVNAAFLIIYIILLNIIQKMKIKSDRVKIILSIIVSLFYINGCSITDDNVSRWAMLSSIIVMYIYLIRMYPQKRKLLRIILFFGILFTLIIGTMFKGENIWNKGEYSTFENTLKNTVEYKTLNAYFSGPKNVEIGLQLMNYPQFNGINKAKVIISDLFNNAPFLNHILSNKTYNSNALFNYAVYNSYIAKDQIIPGCVQAYLWVNVLFTVITFFRCYYAFYFYFKIFEEKDLLKTYCYIRLFIALSLINCISYTILMQFVWINVLPIYLIYLGNIKVKSNILRKPKGGEI